MVRAIPPARSAPVGLLATFAAAADSFRDRYFALYWIDNAFFFVGQGLVLLGAQWAILSLTDSRALLGLMGAVQAVVVILLSPVAGVMADRLARRDILIAGRFGFALVTVVTGVILATGNGEVWMVLVSVALSASFLSFSQPASQTYVFDLVPADRLMTAVALNSLGTGVFQIIGPSLGGGLIASVGAGGTYLVGSAGYVVCGLALLAIPIRGKTAGSHRGFSMTGDIVEGAAHLRRDPLLRWIFLPAILITVFAGAILVMRPVFARDVLHVGASGLGWLGAAFGLGGLVGSLVVIAIGDRFKRKGLIILLSPLNWVLCMALYSQSRWFPLSLWLEFQTGISTAFWATSIIPVLQVRVPEHLRSRVLAFYFMILQGMQLNWLLTGFVADLVGDRMALLMMGLIPAAMLLVMLVFLRPLVRLGDAHHPLVTWVPPDEPAQSSP